MRQWNIVTNKYGIETKIGTLYLVIHFSGAQKRAKH